MHSFVLAVCLNIEKSWVKGWSMLKNEQMSLLYFLRQKNLKTDLKQEK